MLPADGQESIPQAEIAHLNMLASWSVEPCTTQAQGAEHHQISRVQVSDEAIGPPKERRVHLQVPAGSLRRQSAVSADRHLGGRSPVPAPEQKPPPKQRVLGEIQQARWARLPCLAFRGSVIRNRAIRWIIASNHALPPAPPFDDGFLIHVIPGTLGASPPMASPGQGGRHEKSPSLNPSSMAHAALHSNLGIHPSGFRSAILPRGSPQMQLQSPLRGLRSVVSCLACPAPWVATGTVLDLSRATASSSAQPIAGGATASTAASAIATRYTSGQPCILPGARPFALWCIRRNGCNR